MLKYIYLNNLAKVKCKKRDLVTNNSNQHKIKITSTFKKNVL